jgi:Fe-S-cluster containining protein
MKLRPLPKGDAKLVQIVDAALAEASRKSGKWLACRIGCTQCCVGVFAISQLDALRLRHGLDALQHSDPPRARAIGSRARESASRLAAEFPGNIKTGILATDEASRERFEDLGNEEVCPALSPTTGECELYSSRPMTCRVFGPPVRTEQGLGVCELCYEGASEEEIAACELVTGTESLEAALDAEAQQLAKKSGETIIAFCLAAE